MMDDDASFTLLRANPKLTGNIKVVVGSDESMYLDTFKVSLGLSQNKYRHIPINPSEYYGRTIMSKMKDIPSEDLYKVEDYCYNLFAMADNYDEQYYDKYNYGVRTNFDKLYKENFALLAPLCIKKILPDFFLIFKFKNYDSRIAKRANPEIFNIDDVDLVKSFDLRDGTNLGTYIRNIQANALKFTGDVYSGYSYDHFNGYNGISIDRGIVSCVYESTVDERSFNNQVAMNNWYTLGFQRNRMVSKDIVNFEFMFNDESEPLFSNPTYFGVYVKLNGENTEFSCESTDINYNNKFNRTPSGTNFSPSDYDNKNIIYGISTDHEFIRLSDNITKSEIVSKNFCKKPSEGLVKPSIIEINNYINDLSSCHYASFILKEPANPGEHYRLIDNENKIVYEVVIRSGNYDNEISDIYISSFEYYGTTYDNYRIFINNIPNRIDVKESDKKTEIIRQSRLISRCFNIFLTDKLESFSDNDGGVSIIYKNYTGNDRNLLFEWLCSPGEYKYDPIRIFDLPSMQNVHVYTYNSLYMPVGYEYGGDRDMYLAQFINISSMIENRTMLMINVSINDYIDSNISTLYKAENGFNVFDSSSYINDDNLTVAVGGGVMVGVDIPCVLGFGPIRCYLVKFINGEPEEGSTITFCKNTPLNVGPCTIFNIKDFYHDVLDTESKFGLITSDDGPTTDDKFIPSSTPGEYCTNDPIKDPNTRGVELTEHCEEYIHNYIDIYDTFDVSTNGEGKLVLNDKEQLAYYLLTLQNNSHYTSDVSLIEPYCCKWRGLSTDHYGMRMRTMESMIDIGYDISCYKPYFSKNSDASSYFIPRDDEANVGFIISDTSSGYKNIKRDPDIATILEHDEYTIDDTLYTPSTWQNKFSKSYLYGNNEIEFVSAGVKIRIASSDRSMINISKYVNYSCIFKTDINDPNDGYSDYIVIFIDETSEQMEIIAYVKDGNRTINYIKNDIIENKSKQIPEPEYVKAIIKKKNSGSDEITNNQGLRIDIIPPFEIYREDSKYQYTTYGSVHPVYCSPVMIDMFDFNKTYDELNREFDRNFNYSNIILSKIDSVRQTWLQKVPDINNVIQQGTGIQDISYIVDYYVDYKATQSNDDGIVDNLTNKNVIMKTDNVDVPVTVINQVINKSEINLKETDFGYTIYSAPQQFNIDDCEWISGKHLIKTGDCSYGSSTTYGSFKMDHKYVRVYDETSRDYEQKRESDLTRNDLFSVSEQLNLRISRLYDYYVPISDSRKVPQIDQHLYIYVFTVITPQSGPTRFKIVADARHKNEDGSYTEYTVDNIKRRTTSVSDNTYTLSIKCDYDLVGRDVWHYDDGYMLVITNSELSWEGEDSSISPSDDRIIYVTDEYDDLPFYDKNNPDDYPYAISERTYMYIRYANISSKDILAELTFRTTNTTITFSQNPIMYVDGSPEDTILNCREYYRKQEEKSRAIVVLNSTSSLSLYRNLHITNTYWYQKMCRLFQKYDDCIENYGYYSGYEKNCYIASRGITRYGSDYSNTIILDNWVNIVINDNTKTVIIDITSTLFDKINSYPGFQQNWTNRFGSDLPADILTYKNRYIENSIIKNITINDKNLFKVYENSDEKTFEFKTSKPISDDELNRFTLLKNVHNKLYLENNKYYMEITGLDNHSYYAEFYIEL